MPSVVLPDGDTPLLVPTGAAALTTHRRQSFRFELLGPDMGLKGALDGVTGGHASWSAHGHMAVKSSGSMQMRDVGQDIDWLSDRIRVVVEVENYGEWGLGVFLPSAPAESWSQGRRSWEVGLQGLEAVLLNDLIASPYSLDAGSVITDEVRTLIEDAGETGVAITDSEATLANGLVWEAGTSRLRIVNDLLEAANYLSLYTDGQGLYRAEPWTRPSSRPPVWRFLDGPDSIYLDEFTRSQDLASVPNRVICRTQGTGDTEGLYAVAENNDPASRFSIPSRGGKVFARVDDVEAADEPTLQAMAERRLIDASNPTATVEIEHWIVPGMTVNAGAEFAREGAVSRRPAVLTAWTAPFTPTGLARTALQEVVG